MSDQLLLQEILKQLGEVRDDVKEVRKQTTATNGRVTKLELHELNCPIEDIKKQTEVIRFFVKYPKIFYFMAVIIGLIIGINGAELILDILKSL